MKPKLLLFLPVLLLSACSELPLPGGNPTTPETPSTPEVIIPDPSITITGKYVTLGSERWYGGEDIKLSLKDAPSSTTQLNWGISVGEIKGTSAEAIIPYSALNRSLLTGEPVTITAYNGTTKLLETKLRVDDKEPITEQGIYGLWPDGTKRSINTQMYLPFNVTFKANYTDTGVGMLGDQENIPLSVWRNGIKQRESFTNTSELLEASEYEIRAGIIQDKLGNKASGENQTISTINTDFTAPIILSNREYNVTLNPKTSTTEEGNITFTITDPKLADGSTPSGVAQTYFTPTLTSTPGASGNQTVTFKHSDFYNAGLKGAQFITIKAIDGAGNSAEFDMLVNIAEPKPATPAPTPTPTN